MLAADVGLCYPTERRRCVLCAPLSVFGKFRTRLLAVTSAVYNWKYYGFSSFLQDERSDGVLKYTAAFHIVHNYLNFWWWTNDVISQAQYVIIYSSLMMISQLSSYQNIWYLHHLVILRFDKDKHNYIYMYVYFTKSEVESFWHCSHLTSFYSYHVVIVEDRIYKVPRWNGFQRYSLYTSFHCCNKN